MRKLEYAYKDLYVFFLIIYIICLPLNAMNIGPIGSALKLIAIAPVGISFLTGKIRFTTPIIAQLVFTLFAFFSVIWSVSMDSSIGRVIGYALLLALIVSGSAFKYTDSDIRKVKYALAWSSRLTAAVMLIFAEYVNGRFRLMGIIREDPNYICAYLAFGVIFALGVLTEKNTFIRKAFAVAELLLYFYLVLVSGSRGGLLAIMAAAVVYLMTFGEKKIKHIIIKLILLTLVFVAMIVMIDYLPEVLKSRFTIDNVVENGGAGRTDLWKQAFDLFANGGGLRQIFGYGTATVTWCFSKYGYSKINVVHNMFIETLVELGIIGLISYSVAIFTFIKTSFKQKDKFSFAVIFCMLIMSLSTSIYTFKPYFNIMLFIVMLQNIQTADVQTGIDKR